MWKLALCVAGFILLPLSSYAEETKGDCSPNTVLVIGGEYRCVPNISKSDRKEIEDLAKKIETISSRNSAILDEMSRQLKKLSRNSNGNEIKAELRNILSKQQAHDDDVDRRLSVLERELIKETPSSKGKPSPIATLDSVPKLSFIPTKKSRETVQQVIRNSKCASQLADLEKSILDQYPELIQLVIATDSMDCNEKKYWFSIFPSMTDAQVTKLFNILETERRKLEELEIRYQTEILCLNKKHLLEWAEFQRKEAKTNEERDKSLIAVAEATLDIMEHEGCKGIEPNVSYVEQTITDADRLGKTSAGASLLARIYESKKYLNQNTSNRWKLQAYKIDPDDWNNFYRWMQRLLADEDYVAAYDVTKAAIQNNKMAELRSFSENGIARKIWIYRVFADSAEKTRQPPSQSLSQVIKEGYNISKYSLERMPSSNNLRDTIYFAGRFRLLSDNDQRTGLQYLSALTKIAGNLYSEDVISVNDFADISLSISWHCLTLKDFACAIDVSKKAIQAAPSKIVLNSNLAHGLLLSGAKTDAQSLYSKYIGKVVGDRKWESVILDDLNELTAVGVTSPDFRLVRKWVLEAN